LQNYGKRNSFFCARLVHYLGPEAIMLGFMQPEPKRSNSNISAIKPFTSGNRASILGTMCGRVVQSSGPPRYAIVHGLNVRDSRVSNYPPRWNAAPSQELLVIRRNHHTGEVSLDPLRWSLIPYWCKDPTGKRKPINATAETLAKLPSFREAYRKRRCIVPVDGFFEWKAIKGRRAKQPYAIAMKNGSPFGIAGIWENWKDPKTGEWLRTFAIITTDANTLVADRVVCGARECKHASGVSNFDQTPDGQRRNLIFNRYPIAKRSVFNSTT
jgi:putative SOS response-associated peptidase YedK